MSTPLSALPDATDAVPLRLFLIAHPKSTGAQKLAAELMRRFVDPPGRGGLRVSVRFAPPNDAGVPPDWKSWLAPQVAECQHALIVVLADDLMTQEVFDDTGSRWKNFVDEIRRELESIGQQHRLLTLAVGAGGFALCPGRNMVRLPGYPENQTAGSEIQNWLTDATDTAALHIAMHAVSLLQPKAQATAAPGRRPFQLFLSHAKRDLAASGSEDAAKDPVRQMQTYVQDLPIEQWFDARDILAGQDFAKEIEAGIRNCSVVVAILTDHYTSRPWCLEEILLTKNLQQRGPLVVVDALETGEPRSFPWLGNAPVVVWKPHQVTGSCRTILWQSVREALRFHMNSLLLQQTAAQLPSNTCVNVLPSSPEPADLTKIQVGTDQVGTCQPHCILYPDPPLALPELRMLQALRNADYYTPLGLLARNADHLRGQAVCVSVSDSAELPKLGLSILHEQDFTDEIHLSLLLAGLRIVYGGRLENPTAAQGRNFTLRLIDLVRSHAELASNLNTRLEPILNIPPWPLSLMCLPEKLSPVLLNLLNGVAKIRSGPCPDPSEIPANDADGQPLFPAGDNPFTLKDTPLRRLAWTRGMSLMRQQTTIETAARVVMGGKLWGYSGLYPGVLEEAWWSIKLGRPLYLLGALGGAGQAAIDLLENRPRPDLTKQLSPAENTNVEGVLTAAADRGMQICSFSSEIARGSLTRYLADPLSLLTDLQTAGQQGPAAALNNGLTDDENRQLFVADEPATAVKLLLLGLKRLNPNSNV